MSSPASTEDFYEAGDEPFQLRPWFSGTQFGHMVKYQVLVECWGHSRRGKVRRAYEEAFTIRERRILDTWHKRFRLWHLETGTPQAISVPLAIIDLLRRAVQFFAETV